MAPSGGSWFDSRPDFLGLLPVASVSDTVTC